MTMLYQQDCQPTDILNVWAMLLSFLYVSAFVSLTKLALPCGLDRRLLSCPRYLQLLAAVELMFGFTLQLSRVSSPSALQHSVVICVFPSSSLPCTWGHFAVTDVTFGP